MMSLDSQPNTSSSYWSSSLTLHRAASNLHLSVCIPHDKQVVLWVYLRVVFSIIHILDGGLWRGYTWCWLHLHLGSTNPSRSC